MYPTAKICWNYEQTGAAAYLKKLALLTQIARTSIVLLHHSASYLPTTLSCDNEMKVHAQENMAETALAELFWFEIEFQDPIACPYVCSPLLSVEVLTRF
jgi:hypothetical protein